MMNTHRIVINYLTDHKNSKNFSLNHSYITVILALRYTSLVSLFFLALIPFCIFSDQSLYSNSSRFLGLAGVQMVPYY